MALSDYLTDAEWDACFYASFGQHEAENFGDSMHQTIAALLEAGYEFEGLDATGHKDHQIGSGNAQKLLFMVGGRRATREELQHILTSGRDFLKQHLPSLVDETDEEWAAQWEELPK